MVWAALGVLALSEYGADDTLSARLSWSFTQVQFAGILGYSAHSLSLMESGHRPVPTLRRLQEHVVSLLEREDALWDVLFDAVTDGRYILTPQELQVLIDQSRA